MSYEFCVRDVTLYSTSAMHCPGLCNSLSLRLKRIRAFSQVLTERALNTRPYVPCGRRDYRVFIILVKVTLNDLIVKFVSISRQ